MLGKVRNVVDKNYSLALFVSWNHSQMANKKLRKYSTSRHIAKPNVACRFYSAMIFFF